MSSENKDAAPVRKRKPFRRFFYRGYEVHKLLDLSNAELMNLLHSRARRRFSRYGVKNKLVKRLTDAKKKAGPNQRPEPVKTHLRNMIIVPPMVASVVGVYNGLAFTEVEIKVAMHTSVRVRGVGSQGRSAGRTANASTRSSPIRCWRSRSPWRTTTLRC